MRPTIAWPSWFFKAKNSEDAFEVVRQNVQAHFTCHVLEASGQEVR